MAFKITCLLLALAVIVHGAPYGGYGNQGQGAAGGYGPGQGAFVPNQGNPNNIPGQVGPGGFGPGQGGYGQAGFVPGQGGFGGPGVVGPGQVYIPAFGPARPGTGGSFPGLGGQGGYKEHGY